MARTVAPVAVFCFLALHTALGQSDLQPQFELIGSFGSYQMTVPLAINNARQVVGYVTHSGTPSGFSAFQWNHRDGFRLLLNDAVARDINNRGDVVGSRFECVQEPWGSSCASKGFIWNERTGFRDLGDFLPNAVNDSRDMAGTCVNQERGHVVPCALHAGVRTVWECELTKEPCGGEAVGINAAGDAVGYYYYYDYDGDAMLWPRHGEQVVLSSAGYATDISNGSRIAGAVNSIAAVWTRQGERIDSPTTDYSQSLAINAAGLVVGRTLSYPSKAFVWNPMKGALAFLSPDVFMSEPTDINNRGDIVGYVDLGDNIYRFALWHTGGQP